MSGIEIRRIEYGSGDYHQAVKLRQEVLRTPLGLKLSPEELEKDKTDIHIVCLSEGFVVACLVLTPVDGKTCKMRQVAVSSRLQGQGIGQYLVTWTESFSLQSGFHTIILNARENVIGFYERLGYHKIGDQFIEATIPHLKMEKKIV